MSRVRVGCGQPTPCGIWPYAYLIVIWFGAFRFWWSRVLGERERLLGGYGPVWGSGDFGFADVWG